MSQSHAIPSFVGVSDYND